MSWFTRLGPLPGQIGRADELVAVTTMRGLAALAVCWFHVGYWNEQISRTFYGFGVLGPHVFFIISGFVVPWALWRAGYHWSLAHRFFAKRLARLEPPYFWTILLMLLVEFTRASIGADRWDLAIDWRQLVVHVAYVNAFVGLPWYNPVFWTLAIEFQYYVAIALLFPLLCVRDWRARTVTMLAVFCVYVPFHEPTTMWLFSFLPLFMNGFLLFQRAAGIIGAREFWLWSLPLIATSAAHSPLMPGLALLTVYLLLQNRFETRITTFLGQISYSLYLVHAPFAMLQTDVVRYLDTATERVVLAAVTMGLSILAAWIFYRLVERSSINMSKRILYRRQAAVTVPDQTPPIGAIALAEAQRPALASAANPLRTHRAVGSGWRQSRFGSELASFAAEFRKSAESHPAEPLPQRDPTSSGGHRL